MRNSLIERISIHEAGHAVAALVFGIPVVSVTIEHQPRLHRGRYRAPPDLALECLVTLCLAGPEAELEFCGPITDNSDRVDYHWPASIWHDNSIRCRSEPNSRATATPRSVSSRSPYARRRISVLADALLRHGTLIGEEICSVLETPAKSSSTPESYQRV